MKKKMLSIFVVTLLLIATGITVAGTMKLTTDSSGGKEAAAGWGWHNPAGSWMRNDYKLVATSTRVGWGRYAMVGEYLASDPSLGESVPAVALTTIHGNSVATGKNTYDLSQFAYAIDENYDIVYTVVYSGTSEMTSEDTMDAVFYASYYSPNQDPFGEDSPAYGCYGPYKFSYERIPVVPPPCEP